MHIYHTKSRHISIPTQSPPCHPVLFSKLTHIEALPFALFPWEPFPLPKHSL